MATALHSSITANANVDLTWLKHGVNTVTKQILMLKREKQQKQYVH